MVASSGNSHVKYCTRTKRRRAVNHETDFRVNLPSDVVEVLENIENAKKERDQHDVRTELEAIMERVTEALRHIGDKGRIPRTLQEREAFLQDMLSAPEFNLQERRNELSRQQDMLAKIASYAGSLQERKQITHEVRDWLNSEDVTNGVISEEEMKQLGVYYDDINNEIIQTFEYANTVVEKIKLIGQRLLKDAGYNDSDEEEDESGQKIKKVNRVIGFDFNDIIDEQQLLESPINFELAMAEVKTILDQGIRMVKKQTHKNTMRAGVKQMKFIVKAVTSRIKENSQLTQDLLNCRMQLDSYTNTVGYKEEVQQKNQEIDLVENKVIKLEKRIATLEAEKDELAAKLTSVEERHAEVQSVGSANTFDENNQSTEFAGARVFSKNGKFVHFNDSMVSMATAALQGELDKAVEDLQTKSKLLEATETELRTTRLELEKLQARVHMVETVKGESNKVQNIIQEDAVFSLRTVRDEKASLQKQVEQLVTELDFKNELIQYQEKRLKEMREEMGIIEMDDIVNAKSKDGKLLPDKFKATMMRMTKEFTDDVNRLKSHIEKEKARHDAAIRKIEQKHKEDMASTFKQIVHLLRAINRFKESIAGVLDRERLPLAASDVRKIPDLTTFENQGDARALLSQMAGGAVELLVNVEFKLSQALLNKRLEVKDNSIAKNFANRDLEAQMEFSLKTKMANENMATNLNTLKTKLNAAEEAITVMRKFEDWRYESINKRYHRIVNQYNTLSQDKIKKEKEYKRTLKEIEMRMKMMITKRDSIANIVEEQQNLISQMQNKISQSKDEHTQHLQLSIADQRQNLALIERAFQENKLSKEMHDLTADLVKASMDLPALRLKSLFERYIAYRKLKDAKGQLKEKAERISDERRKSEIETYLNRIDYKITKSIKSWQEQMSHLQETKAEIFERLQDAFTSVVQETGILLVLPQNDPLVITGLGSHDHPLEETIKPPTPSEKSCFKLPRIHSVQSSLQPPDGLTGKSLKLERLQDKFWETTLFDRRKLPHLIKIETPHMVDYEINKQMISAQRTLARMHHKVQFPLNIVRGFEYSRKTVAPLSDSSTFISGYGDTTDSSSTQDASIYAESNTASTQDSGIQSVGTAASNEQRNNARSQKSAVKLALKLS